MIANLQTENNEMQRVQPNKIKTFKRAVFKRIVNEYYINKNNTFATQSKPMPEKEKMPWKTHGAVMPLVGSEIQQAKDYLLNKNYRYDKYGFKIRNYTIFCFGINVGLRESDLLKLKISDVMKDGEIVDYISVKEEKTKNTKKPNRIIDFNQGVKTLLKEYIDSLENWEYDWYLFHGLKPERTPYKQMTRNNLSEIMKDIQKGLNLKVELGTHSLRKSFARSIFERLSKQGDYMAIEKLKNLLGHSSTQMTSLYIGLQREDNKKIYSEEMI